MTLTSTSQWEAGHWVPLAVPASVSVELHPVGYRGIIPRFVDGADHGVVIGSIRLRHVTALFPFVTNQYGYDTGIALTNAYFGGT